MKTELILEIIRERWSPYSFSPTTVEEYKLKAIFEAAAHAPSSNNEQPWIFVYSTRQNMRIFEDYIEFLSEKDKLWAGNSYAIVITMARTKFKLTGQTNKLALYETGMAVANLLLQAYSMDIFAHQMNDFKLDRVREYLSIGTDIQPVTMMAIGYMGDGSSLAPKLLKEDEQRRPRRQVNEYTFRNTFSEQGFK